MRQLRSATGADMFVFESMAETIEYSEGKAFQNSGKAFVGEDIPDWEALGHRVERTWAEGMYIMNMYTEKLRTETLPDLKSHKRKVEFNAQEGDEMDMDKFQAGDPNYWRTSTREESTGDTEVTIITDTTTPAQYDSDDVLWRGAVALALTQLLEEKGYRVELWVVNGSTLYEGNNRGVCTAACLKRCSDPLDISTLINTVSGWFYRSATFTLLRSICLKNGKTFKNNLGAAYTLQPKDLNEISRDPNRIYSSGMFSFSGSYDVIKAELSRFKDKETK